MRQIGQTIITCNKCGKEVVLDYTTMSQPKIESQKAQMYEINLPKQGYGSYFDGLELNFDVCDECLMIWFDMFKHKPLPENTYTKGFLR